jgi:DNA-directed RNA polymerase specialized sigma24 family protein
MPLLETIARTSPHRLLGKGSARRMRSWHLPLAARRAVLEKALGLLPMKKRLVVALRHYEGLSLTEMAQAMGSDVETVRSLLDDAVVRLSRALLKADEEMVQRASVERRKAA